MSHGIDFMVISGGSATLGIQPAGPAVSFEESMTLELDAIRAEAMGWIPLSHGAYLHHSSGSDADRVIEVVGVPGPRMFEINVVLLV